MTVDETTYIDRCQQVSEAMHRDNWPRLHSPMEGTAPREPGQPIPNTYAVLYRAEIAWRLKWGADKGSLCPDQTGTAYQTSWVMLSAHNERTNGKTS